MKRTIIQKGASVILKSLGAAGTVTGSKHLLKTPELSLLIDCGLFQGIKHLRIRNRQPLSEDPASIDAVILTHAHLDHCGYLPLLVKEGFKGDIYMTAPTADLAKIILADSAKIQEEDAENANKGKYSKHKPALPLYTLADAEKCFNYFRIVSPQSELQLSPNVSFKFWENGHILGSCSVQLTAFGRYIVFSGDLGGYNSDFIRPPESPDEADFLVMEATYGDRLRPQVNAADHLAAVINRTLAQRGNVLISSFAVGRAQELMHIINDLKAADKIPAATPVYLDSPMAADVTSLLQKYMRWHRLTREECARVNNDIHINRDYHNTKKIISNRTPKIVIAASGMLTGGRVLEYLKRYVTHPQNTILIIGYQVEGTRGRALQNRTHELKLFGKYYPVRAGVTEISGLSAHADQSELLTWLERFRKKPERIFLVHGEPTALDALRVKIETVLRIPVHIQQDNQEVVLFSVSEEPASTLNSDWFGRA